MTRMNQILYNCHTDGDQYRITKFNDGEVESTYLCTVDECECPAGVRPTCRHRHMLPRFIAKGAVNSFYFYDYDRQGWVTNEPARARAEDWTRHEAEIEPAPLTITTMRTIPDDANVAEEFAKLLHPEPMQIEPKLYHEQSHNHDEEQLAFYQAGVVEEPEPTPPEPTIRRRI